MKKNKGIFIAVLLAIIVAIYCFYAVYQSPLKSSIPETDSRGIVWSSIDNTEIADELTSEDEKKLNSWKNRPDDQLYLAYKKVFDNPRYFNQKTGEVIWPPNNGAVEGTNKLIVLEAGTQIDSYGSEDGFFASPINTPYNQRSCAPGSDRKPYHQYIVLKPIENVEQGVTAPWFDEPGGGIQYMMTKSIKELLNESYLKRLT